MRIANTPPGSILGVWSDWPTSHSTPQDEKPQKECYNQQRENNERDSINPSGGNLVLDCFLLVGDRLLLALECLPLNSEDLLLKIRKLIQRCQNLFVVVHLREDGRPDLTRIGSQLSSISQPSRQFAGKHCKTSTAIRD